MNLKLFLHEDYVGRVKSIHKTFPAAEVFKNPSPKELLGAAVGETPTGLTAVRFIAVPSTKSLYVWHAMYQTHLDVSKELNIHEYPYESFYGTAEVKAGRLVPEDDIGFGYKVQRKDISLFTHYFKDLKPLLKIYSNKEAIVFEEYEAAIQMRSKSLPIFVNPDSKEMSEIGPNIRFIADFKTKKLYVWDGMEAEHYSVIKKLDVWGKNNKIESCALGQGMRQNRKFIITAWLFIGKKDGRHYSKEDFKWIMPWIAGIDRDMSLDWLRRKLEIINEEYLGRFETVHKGSVEVYTDPSINELSRIVRNNSNSIRFIAIPKENNKMYVWHGEGGLHGDIAHVAKLGEYSLHNTFFGEGKFIHGKIDHKGYIHFQTGIKLQDLKPFQHYFTDDLHLDFKRRGW